MARTPPTQEQGGLPLMAVMEIQRTLGTLKEAVEHLREAQHETNVKLTEVSQKVHTAQTVAWVVGVGLMTVLGFVGWLVTNALQLLPSIINSPK